MPIPDDLAPLWGTSPHAPPSPFHLPRCYVNHSEDSEIASSIQPPFCWKLHTKNIHLYSSWNWTSYCDFSSYNFNVWKTQCKAIQMEFTRVLYEGVLLHDCLWINLLDMLSLKSLQEFLIWQFELFYIANWRKNSS